MDIHIDSAEQHAPKPENGFVCMDKLPNCPGDEGQEMGYGLAGGGCGVYAYCPVRHRVTSKTQDTGE